MSDNNWGRWGADDERGMLNLVTPHHVAGAARLVNNGVVYNLAVPLGEEGRKFPPHHETWRVTTLGRKRTGAKLSGDVLMMHTHAGTHVDALSHFWIDGKLWNDRDDEAVNSFIGVNWAGIDKVGSIVTRGVLADVARFRGVDHLSKDDVIGPIDLEQCLDSQEVALGEGDVLLVRTGWHGVFDMDHATWDSGHPGVSEDCAGWLNGRGVVAIGADTVAVEHAPQHPHDNPFHVRALRDYGIYIIENLDLEALSQDEAYEFLFVAAPLPIVGGSGGQAVPVAIT